MLDKTQVYTLSLSLSLRICNTYCFNTATKVTRKQWRNKDFVSGRGVTPGIMSEAGGSTNSVDDRGQRERGSGGVSPPSQGFHSICKWVKPVSWLGCHGCIFHGTGNSAQLCQNFWISGEWTPQTPPRYATARKSPDVTFVRTLPGLLWDGVCLLRGTKWIFECNGGYSEKSPYSSLITTRVPCGATLILLNWKRGVSATLPTNSSHLKLLWGWKQHDSPKHWYPPTRPNNVTNQKSKSNSLNPDTT
jgi:hypothetical protein